MLLHKWSPKNGGWVQSVHCPRVEPSRRRVDTSTAPFFLLLHTTSRNLYRSYYPHRSRELMSPVCGIFKIPDWLFLSCPVIVFILHSNRHILIKFTCSTATGGRTNYISAQSNMRKWRLVLYWRYWVSERFTSPLTETYVVYCVDCLGVRCPI